jgi:hypothetical protein
VIVTQLWPTSLEETKVHSSILVHPHDLTEAAKLVERDIQFVQVGLSEDYAVAEKIQEALRYGKSDQFIAGPFEAQIEHFHKQLRIC